MPSSNSLSESLSDLPSQDWAQIAREIACPPPAEAAKKKGTSAFGRTARREGLLDFARQAAGGGASRKPKSMSLGDSEKMTIEKARAWGAMAARLIRLGGRSIAQSAARWMGKKSKIAAFEKLADRLEADASERLVFILEKTVSRVKNAEIAQIGKRGRDFTSQKARQWIEGGSAADAAELFLRHPFDPRGPRGGFAQSLMGARDSAQASGGLAPREEALIGRAIELAKALGEAIELRQAAGGAPASAPSVFAKKEEKNKGILPRKDERKKGADGVFGADLSAPAAEYPRGAAGAAVATNFGDEAGRAAPSEQSPVAPRAGQRAKRL